ncbi:MAG: acetoin dehydrogenase dihydrolipoyllysine-residue acetyltransferase subunit [Pseudomonadota bacterium]
MPIEVIMPKVDMDMSSGRIVTWHVAPGNRVEKGAPLFDIETDKAAMEIEAPSDGILHDPVDEGTDVPIGKPVAWLYADGEEIRSNGGGDAPRRLLGGESEPKPEPAPPPRPAPDRSVEKPAAKGIRATPLARKLAGEAGVELRDVEGTGARGRVQADDVERALEARSAAPVTPAPRTDAGPLAVTRSEGGAGMPIVLLHGFASDSASWALLERHLDDRPVIRVDLPAHGRSQPESIDSFAGLAAEVRRTIDSLGVEKVHLMGHSLGGALALALADTRARLVASLTLIAPAGLGPEIEGAVLDGIARASRAESLAPWLKRLVADEALVTDGYVRAAMAVRQDEARQSAQRALLGTLFPDGVQAFDLRAALGRVEMPARILWGRQDAIIPWQHALRAPGRVALHLLERIGHLPQIEAPEDVGKIVRAYL